MFEILSKWLTLSVNAGQEAQGADKREQEEEEEETALTTTEISTMLTALLTTIDKAWFKTLNFNASSISSSKALLQGQASWILEYSRMSRMLKLMLGYYQEVLQRKPVLNSKTINLTAISKEGSWEELTKMMILAFGISVSYVGKKLYIDIIQLMEQEEAKSQLLALIEDLNSVQETANISNSLLEFSEPHPTPVTSQIYKLEGRLLGGRAKSNSSGSGSSTELTLSYQRNNANDSQAVSNEANQEIEHLKEIVKMLTEGNDELLIQNHELSERIERVEMENSHLSLQTTKLQAELKGKDQEMIGHGDLIETTTIFKDQGTSPVPEEVEETFNDFTLIEINSSSSSSKKLQVELEATRLLLQNALAETQDVKLAARREQRLMMSSWYKLGLELQEQRQPEQTSEYPSSWLAQQRFKFK